jgi:Flp pilus assembly protein protease CpaA
LGGVFGYLIIWLIIYFYKKVRKKEGMGLGDAKLLSAIGFWFGWLSIPFTIFISSLVALILVILLDLFKIEGQTSIKATNDEIKIVKGILNHPNQNPIADSNLASPRPVPSFFLTFL